MKGVLLIISSTRMSQTSVEHAMRLCKSDDIPLHVTFILDSELADSIFNQLTMEGYLGDKPGEKLREAVLEEYEMRGRAKIEMLCNLAKENNLECNTVFQRGNFLDNCRNIISEKQIKHIVITRLKRSHLSRFIFGSAIDQLKREFPDIEFEVFEEE